MKNFIEKNWFKLFMVVVVIGLIFSYFFILLPKNEKNLLNKKLIENQIKCKEKADEFTKRIDTTAPYGAVYSEPEYVFANDLNTCLYRIGYSAYLSEGSRQADSHSIIDIYSNRTLINLYKHYDSKGVINYSNGNEVEYSSYINKYFNK